MPYPARVPRVRHRGETLQQVPAGRGAQAGGMRRELFHGQPGAHRRGHARLDGQRGLPAGMVTSALPVLAGTPVPSCGDTPRARDVTGPGQSAAIALTART